MNKLTSEVMQPQLPFDKLLFFSFLIRDQISIIQRVTRKNNISHSCLHLCCFYPNLSTNVFFKLPINIWSFEIIFFYTHKLFGCLLPSLFLHYNLSTDKQQWQRYYLLSKLYTAISSAYENLNLDLFHEYNIFWFIRQSSSGVLGIR